MTQAERKVIRAKVGLLELARQLGNVTQACRVLGYTCPIPDPRSATQLGSVSYQRALMLPHQRPSDAGRRASARLGFAPLGAPHGSTTRRVGIR